MTAVLNPPTVTAIDVKAPEFIRALTVAATFASTDYTIPLLGQVRIVGDGKTLTFVATNRYVLGTVTVAYDGPSFETGIDLRDVKTVTAMVKAMGKHGVVTLQPTNCDDGQPHTLTVKTWDGSTTFRVQQEFIKWAYLIPSDPKGDVEAIALDPAYLALFAKVTGKGTPMRLRFNGPTKPVRVEIGDDFVGILMPMRLAS